jgi:hypothetical protein
MNGNPMRWDCGKRGCFNKLKRPKIEQFNDCFPRGINFGDCDGLVEINGHGLILEWKPDAIVFSTGQRLAYTRLTHSGLLTVLCIAGNAETMAVTHLAGFVYGKWRPWITGNLDDAKTKIKAWVSWAERKPLKGTVL